MGVLAAIRVPAAGSETLRNVSAECRAHRGPGCGPVSADGDHCALHDCCNCCERGDTPVEALPLLDMAYWASKVLVQRTAILAVSGAVTVVGRRQLRQWQFREWPAGTFLFGMLVLKTD